ncbi:acyl-CoA dehydrogenase family protein [Lysinibacillus pakistanensis]|uniref:Acyl-CoA dehydrogenase family protein n=1 Tax=Lysinibacillus pakistanensis TaxID=759811 RepID=A0AAX3WUV3_9BACI|nr:acyl-CoA dehydrogenase family protein [Lysinibacillus pakistanensis]MDM5231026.1 acyl-CoA dehydrogenase family protein [Lysinibacillus pakistanensis]WHY46588.1 acyl-CoA dehydrogenase family protein [Lysinibacillus pakistanensis]WHY51601.1 acyl-CoA dehydrogenase family protein [Lysinibacillus pakistanensis]
MKDLFIKTAQQKYWLDQLASIAEPIRTEAKEVDEQSRFPFEAHRLLLQIGYPRLTLPKEFGGEGLSVYDMVLIQETLASYDENASLSLGWTLGVVGEIYETKLWAEDALHLLAPEIKNGAIINRAVSEAATGSPTRGGRPGTNAISTKQGWLLNGRKIFTTASPVLDYFLTSAWIEEKNQIGFFLIHKDVKGLSIEENWEMSAMRGTSSHDLVLTDVVVPSNYLVELPSHPSGGKINGWILHIPATYLGIAQAARDYALHFANHHQPNSLNAPISTLPNVQQLLGDIELKLHQARFVLYGVAEAYDDPARREFLTNEMAVAKHTVTNLAIDVVDKAMRVVGAKSLQLTNPLQRYYRNVRAGLHNPPMDDMTIIKLATAAIEQQKMKEN